MGSDSCGLELTLLRQGTSDTLRKWSVERRGKEVMSDGREVEVGLEQLGDENQTLSSERDVREGKFCIKYTKRSGASEKWVLTICNEVTLGK